MIASAGSTTARAASGSRSSIWLIEPLMSANNTVMVFRSPSATVEDSNRSATTRSGGATDVVSGGGAGAAVALAVITAPHSPQNFSPGSLDAPHRAHLAAIATPHWAQN